MSHAIADIVPVCLALEDSSPCGTLHNPGSVQSFNFTFDTEKDLNSFVMALFQRGFYKKENLIKNDLNLLVKIDN